MKDEFYKNFTDGCDKENDYYDSSFTEGRPCRVFDFIEQEVSRAVAEERGRIKDFAESMIMEITPIEESISAGMSQSDAQSCYDTAKGYNMAAEDLLALITPPSEGEDNRE